jgi:hypothetical protein
MKSSAELLGVLLGRTQTPKAELLMQELVYDALKALLESSYLYQNKRIDLADIVKLADKACPENQLRDEFEHRPWIPYSQNRGFTTQEQQVLKVGGAGVDPLGTPPRQMRLHFIIPTIDTHCYKCKAKTLHDSIPHIDCDPYHLNPKAIEEPLGFRTFLFNMQCQRCKCPPITFMIRREKLKLQLCGRSQPYFPEPPQELPANLRDIFNAGVAAAGCDDLPAAFYHLRTLMEHHMKLELGLPLDQPMTGDELCAAYNKSLDPVVAGRCSLTGPFETCSKNLHGRMGTHEVFEKVKTLIVDHFKLRDTLKRLSN